MLNAAKDVSSVKDVLTGDTAATAPVGTTMAVADQALQPFNAVFKRVYRGLTRLFQLIYECEARWGTTDDQEYQMITGDPTGSFKQDFIEGQGNDIRPISDPRTVTSQQRLAKAQGLMQVATSPLGAAAHMDAQEVAKDVLSAMDYENVGKYFAQAPAPDPAAQAMQQAELEVKQTEAVLNRARAVQAAGAHALSVQQAANAADNHQRDHARADNQEARADAVAAHGILSTIPGADGAGQPGGVGDVAQPSGDAVGDDGGGQGG